MKHLGKKLSVIALALIVMLMACLPVMAESSYGGSGEAVAPTGTSTASVTVTTGNGNDTLKMYKVIAANFNPTTNDLTYAFSANFNAFKASTANQTPDYSALTVDQYAALGVTDLQAVHGAYSAYLKANTTLTADYSGTTDADGNATITDVAMGQYVILGSSSGAKIYQAVSVSVVPELVNNAYVIYPTYTVAMKVSTPEGSKTVTGTKENNSVEIGDTLTYTIDATVPTYPTGATNTTFYMGDTLSNGLSFTSTAVVVKGYTQGNTTGATLTADDQYTIAYDGQKLYIDFDYDKIKGYERVEATYTAIVNENAVIGTAGNTNSYDLIYSNDPFNGATSTTHPVPGTPGYGTDNSTVIVNTYMLAIKKYEDGNQATVLEGAEFAIYDNQSCAGNAIATITTDANGYAAYAGLAEGTYYLKETKAPSGYKLMSGSTPVTITSTSAVASSMTATTAVTYTSNTEEALLSTQARNAAGELLYINADNEVTTDATRTENETSVNNAPAYVKTITTTASPVEPGTEGATLAQIQGIANTKGSSLPNTGAMGTMMLYLIGGTAAVAALVVLISRKRMQNS